SSWSVTYYSSTMDVFEHLLPDVAPHGCLFYFNDGGINFYAEKAGELRAIAEVNAGKFGPHVCLVEHPLWIETGEIRHYKQVYRLFNLEMAERAARSRPPTHSKQVGRSNRISPLGRPSWSVPIAARQRHKALSSTFTPRLPPARQ